MTNKEEIIRALSLWFRPGDVFEVRVLGATSSGNRQEHTISGYFDFEHIMDAAGAISKLYACRGVYATANPVKRDLLARAMNRLRSLGRSDPTTSDTDIERRRWLLIDCDANRPVGISSTDAEHEAALAKVREIRDGLSSLGWPQPIMTDSGNGAQLMYAIDLPADDNGLVKKCLESIAIASDDCVHVDLTVFNPARIWRIPGTMNCKGDNAEGFRPHRMARIIEAPTDLITVTEEQLRSVAGDVQEVTQSITTFQNEGDSFDLDDWIAEHCHDIQEAQPYKDGRKWIFPVCPFDANHSNKSAALFQNAAGAIGFRCLHNGCLGNDWRKLRVMLEPGCYDQKAEDPGVDISGILGQKNANKLVIHLADPSMLTANLEGIVEPDEEDTSFVDPGPLPDKLTHIPGFIDEYAQWIMDTAPYPNRVLAFSAALAFLSFLTGRKVTDIRRNRTNIYLIALANPGTGKDHPRKMNIEVATSCDLDRGLADDFGSGEGLEDSLFLEPTMFYQVDEFDTLLNSLKLGKDAKSEAIIDRLLRFYGTSNGTFKMRKLAMRREDRSKDRGEHTEFDRKIVNPHLCIFGTAIPKYFYAALSPRVINNGLTARCLVVEAGKRGHGQKPQQIEVPENIKRSVEVFKGYGGPGNITVINAAPMLIPATPEADARLDELNEKYDLIYDEFEAKVVTTAMTFWARVFEKVCKLSMLYAISTNPMNPVISIEALDWAEAFVDHLTRQMLFMVSAYSFENQFDEICRNLVAIVRKRKGSVRHWKLLKDSRLSSEMFEKVIATLLDNRTIEAFDGPSKTKKGKFYRLL